MAGFANTFGLPAPATDPFHAAVRNYTPAPQAPAPAPSAPAAPKGPTFADFISTPVTATKASTAVVGPAPSFRQAYNGQVYTDPSALAKAQAANVFQPVTYNGTEYKDAGQYANAVLGDAQKQHDDSVKQINAAHSNGLISFDQQQKLIDQSRTSLKDQLESTLSGQSGYFNSISPDAVQSTQKTMADKSQGQYDQGVGQINDQQTNLGTQKNDFEANYANSVQGADKGLLGAKDAAANIVQGNKQNVQSTLDAGQNAAIAFQNQLANYQASAASAKAPTVTQFDPTQLVQGISSSLVNANAAGISADQALPSILATLHGQGIDSNSPQVQAIVKYAVGQVTDASTTYGNAYAKKSPLATALGQ